MNVIAVTAILCGRMLDFVTLMLNSYLLGIQVVHSRYSPTQQILALAKNIVQWVKFTQPTDHTLDMTDRYDKKGLLELREISIGVCEQFIVKFSMGVQSCNCLCNFTHLGPCTGAIYHSHR